MKANKIVYKSYGGKAVLAKWIVSHFPEHRVYVEPFCGSCAVLFAKPKSFVEVVNDINEDIINMFNKIREEPEKLAALLWATPYAKSNWRDQIESMDDLERARLFMAKSVQFYCGDQDTSTWAMDCTPVKHKPKPNVWADWFLRILPAAARLKDAHILNEDALDVIKRFYKRKETLIYVDPPYYGHEREYTFKVDYERMVELLSEATAKVVVSEYEAAEEFYRGFRKVTRESKNHTASARNEEGRKKVEVLYMNF